MEATIVCVDNSEWTRNGDFSPDRFQAQADAVNLLAGSKMQDNPENGVGILTMAGKAPQVLVTPTSDLSKVLNCMAALSVEGEFSNICTSVQVAQLALKHRSNKNQRQRIVLFSGSPVTEDKVQNTQYMRKIACENGMLQETLLKIAKKLKKNNVAVDIVCFGCGEESVEKLQSFINAVQSSDNCHFIDIQQGSILSDALIGTPIFQGENAAAFGASTSVGGDGDFNVDPNMDPELALALRVSMEEERERQSRAAAAAAAAAGEGSSSQMETTQEQPTAEDPNAVTDESLLQAIAMSMQDTEMETGGDASARKKVGDAIEDAELEAALKMSLEAQHGSSDSIINPEFVNTVLSSLKGVDVNDPQVQQAIEKSGKQGGESSSKEEEESKKEGKGPKDPKKDDPSSKSS